jgi:hypothetical protein
LAFLPRQVRAEVLEAEAAEKKMRVAQNEAQPAVQSAVLPRPAVRPWAVWASAALPAMRAPRREVEQPQQAEGVQRQAHPADRAAQSRR